MILVARHLRDDRVGNFLHDLGLAGARHLGRAEGSIGVRRVTAVELERQAHLRGIGVLDGQPAQGTVRLHHVDRAPVREAGNGEPRDLVQRALVIDDGGQGGAGIGQEAGRVLGPLLLADVGVGAEPGEDPAVVAAERIDPGEEGAEDAVRSPQREHHVEGLAAGDRCLPALEDGGQDLGVVDALPAPALHLLRGGARVLVPATVVPEDVAVGRRHPHELRDGVRHQAEFLLALVERLLRAVARGHVLVHQHHLADVARRVLQRVGDGGHPAPGIGMARAVGNGLVGVVLDERDL